MRMIDADALKMRIEDEKKERVNVGYLAGLCIAEEYINNAPTLEPKTGRWSGVRYDAELGLFVCDNCGKFSLMEYAFCPNCGADMRGEKE